MSKTASQDEMTHYSTYLVRKFETSLLQSVRKQGHDNHQNIKTMTKMPSFLSNDGHWKPL